MSVVPPHAAVKPKPGPGRAVDPSARGFTRDNAVDSSVGSLPVANALPSETSKVAAIEDAKFAASATESVVSTGAFRIAPRHAVTAILPSSQVDWCSSELRDAGFSKANIEVLRGEEGRDMFDINGTHHGVRGQVIRAIQVAGSIHNEMLNYDTES